MSAFRLIAALLMLAFEFQNVLSWYTGKTLNLTDASTDDYTIVVPLFGHPRYFSAKASLHSLKPRVLVACEISLPVMAAYADSLEAEGWLVERFVIPEVNTARLVKAGMGAVTTTYCLRLDADTLLDARIANAVAAFAASGADLVSTRVEVKSPSTLAERFQALEYKIAMLTRRYRPWLTSGACYIGRTEALNQIWTQHSMWAAGEDIETGRVALALGMKIRHVDYVVHTTAPASFYSLFRQRRSWWAGNFRHTVINFDRNIMQLPMFTLYSVLGAWIAVTYHIWTLFSLQRLLFVIGVSLISSVFIVFIANIRVASPWMIIYPVYAMLQSLVLPTFGAIRYAQVAHTSRSLGRYRFGRGGEPRSA